MQPTLIVIEPLGSEVVGATGGGTEALETDLGAEAGGFEAFLGLLLLLEELPTRIIRRQSIQGARVSFEMLL